MKKSFHTLDILSITTGRLVSPDHMDGVYSILGWMTGRNLSTHELPPASDICKPHLLRCFPQLNPLLGGMKSLDKWLRSSPTCPREGIKMRFAEQKMMFPEIKDFYNVPRLEKICHDD